MSTTLPFNLSGLGAELDQARRNRINIAPVSIPSQAPLPLPVSALVPAESPRVKCTSPIPAQNQNPGEQTTVKVQEVASSLESDTYMSMATACPNHQANEGSSDTLENGASCDIIKQKKNEQECAVGREIEKEERPYPLCLLCLTRPPSAVLLPCCHLNLCHLCAPLLIEKHRPPPPSSLNPLQVPALPSSSSASASASAPTRTTVPPHHVPEYTRTPYNVLLFRAIANHPKSRALAMGGYIAPKKGYMGGEMDGCDLVSDSSRVGQEDHERGMDMMSSCQGAEKQKEKDDVERETIAEQVKEKERRMGIRVEHVDQGRVTLSSSRTAEEGRAQPSASASARGGAVCLICRQGVKGWLRVYTG
ncbi:hypothetical protein IAT40_002527 [Kwoniella sp. CBS 6097]